MCAHVNVKCCDILHVNCQAYLLMYPQRFSGLDPHNL